MLEDQLHFDRWEALVQEFEPVPVLVLQSLVKLAVPMQAPRALGSLRETELQAAKDAPHLLDGRGPPIFSAHQVSLHQHAHLVREDLVPFPQCPVLLCEFVGDALEAHHVALQRSGVAPGDGLPHAVPRVRQNLFELHSVLKQHRLLAGDHLRRDVVVEVGHLLQHHPVPVELMRGGDFVLDLFRHGEAHGRELPCLLQERDQIVAVLQDDLAVLTFEVHQLPVLLDLDVLQMVLGGLLPRLEQGALLRPNVLQQVLGCAADDLHHGIRALTVQSLEHPAGGSDLPLALHHPAQGADQRRDVLVEPLAVRSPRPRLSERASAPGIRPGEAGGVRPLLEVAPQDLQIALHVPQQREALGLHRRRHQRAGEQPAVLLKLLEYLVGLRDGLRIAAPVLGDGRTEGGEDSPREHLLELVADALFDGLHAPAVLLLGGLPQGVVELAHVERVHLLEGSEGLPGGQRRSLLRGQQVPDLLVRRAQRKDVFHAGLERPARRKARLAALEDVRVVPADPLQAGEHVHHVTPLAQNPHCQLQGVVHFSEGCMPHVEALVAPQHVPFDDGPDGVHEAAHALRAVGPRPPVAHAPQRAQPVLRIIQEPQHVFPEGLDARGAVGARRQRAAEGLQQGVDLRGAGALPRVTHGVARHSHPVQVLVHGGGDGSLALAPAPAPARPGPLQQRVPQPDLEVPHGLVYARGPAVRLRPQQGGVDGPKLVVQRTRGALRPHRAHHHAPREVSHFQPPRADFREHGVHDAGTARPAPLARHRGVGDLQQGAPPRGPGRPEEARGGVLQEGLERRRAPRLQLPPQPRVPPPPQRPGHRAQHPLRPRVAPRHRAAHPPAPPSPL